MNLAAIAKPKAFLWAQRLEETPWVTLSSIWPSHAQFLNVRDSETQLLVCVNWRSKKEVRRAIFCSCDANKVHLPFPGSTFFRGVYHPKMQFFFAENKFIIIVNVRVVGLLSIRPFLALNRRMFNAVMPIMLCIRRRKALNRICRIGVRDGAAISRAVPSGLAFFRLRTTFNQKVQIDNNQDYGDKHYFIHNKLFRKNIRAKVEYPTKKQA